MTPVVVEVGPVTVRGPGIPPATWAEAAVAGLGDRLTVVDDRIAEVDRLLHDVLVAAAGGPTRLLALVVPSWWPARWASIVVDAARAVADDVRLFRRGPLLSSALGVAVAEVGADVVAIAEPDRPLRLHKRDGDGLPVSLARSAVIDVAPGVAAPPAVTDRLSRRDDVEAAVTSALAPARPRIRRPVAVALAAGTVMACVLPWVLRDRSPEQWRLLVEGRAAIEVPADWTADRITSGPGSARVRIAASEGLPAVHLTQSLGPAGLADIAESLRRAITSAPAGVFVDFRPDGTVGDRSAVTYREVRDGSQTQWAVVGDGEVRIAIGCQSAPGDADSVATVCARAVHSAHAVY